MGEAYDALQFDAPPVRAVRLTLNLKQAAIFQMKHVASIYSLWEKRYATVEQSPPELPDPLAEDSEETWPLPASRFTDETGSKSILFQDGIFNIRWKFDQASKYPGFQALKAELIDRYEEFTKSVEDAGLEIDVISVECRYENLIETLSGTELAIGILSEWANPSPGRLSNTGYLGVRIHTCASPENHNCSSYVAVDSDVDQPAILSISVQRDRDPDAMPTDTLDAVHAEELALFLRFTNSELRQEWGLHT